MPDPQRIARGVARRARRLRVRATAKVLPGRPRTVPDPRDVPTKVGPLFDAGVAGARTRMRPAGIDADYDVAYEGFDLTHFLLQARHMLSEDVDPLDAWLANGATAKASPEINFDMRKYVARNPHRARSIHSPYVAWLREGRAAGEVADPAPGLELIAPVLGRPVPELVAYLSAMRSDIQERLRTGRLGEMVAKAADIEPLIGDVWSETHRMKIYPFFDSTNTVQVAAIHNAQKAAGFKKARAILVISDPRWGASRRAEGHLAHALARHLDASEVVVIYTEEGGEAPPGRFPKGVRELDLGAKLAGLDVDSAGRVLVELIRSFEADLVVNINSVLLYQTMKTYGRALRASQRIFQVMLCNEQLALGNWVGLPMRYFYRNTELVEGVITDSTYMRDWLVERHQLPTELSDKVHVFKAPVDSALQLVTFTPRAPGARPQVYWAGRLDRQKRVDLAFEIARRMPDADFHIWGEEVLTAPLPTAPPTNVRLHGPYRHITDLDLGRADAWLYTSAWDGVPNQLLEVAMTGVPLVGSEVGGTGEVLASEDSWPVADADDPDAYVSRLREVLADQEGARQRAVGLRKRLVAERTEEAYDELVARVLLGLDTTVDETVREAVS